MIPEPPAASLDLLRLDCVCDESFDPSYNFVSCMLYEVITCQHTADSSYADEQEGGDPGVGHVAPGIRIPLHPFFGNLGVAPPMGRLSSGPPTYNGGNMDNKWLVVV